MTGAVHVQRTVNFGYSAVTADEVSQKRQVSRKRVLRCNWQAGRQDFPESGSQGRRQKSWSVVEDGDAGAKIFAATELVVTQRNHCRIADLVEHEKFRLCHLTILIMNPGAGEFQISYNENSRPGVARWIRIATAIPRWNLMPAASRLQYCRCVCERGWQARIVVLTKTARRLQILFRWRPKPITSRAVNADATTAC